MRQAGDGLYSLRAGRMTVALHLPPKFQGGACRPSARGVLRGSGRKKLTHRLGLHKPPARTGNCANSGPCQCSTSPSPFLPWPPRARSPRLRSGGCHTIDRDCRGGRAGIKTATVRFWAQTGTRPILSTFFFFDLGNTSEMSFRVRSRTRQVRCLRVYCLRMSR